MESMVENMDSESPMSRNPTKVKRTIIHPHTAARSEDTCMMSVIEGRGVGKEIGLASLSMQTGRAVLGQISDSQTYIKTLHQIFINKPSVVIVPDTFLSFNDTAASTAKTTSRTSFLIDSITEEFPNILVDPVSRKYWNEAGGLEYIKDFCIRDDERAGTILASSNKYYALSALCALFKYSEMRLNTRFAAHSLQIKYTPTDGTMMIDPETAKNLELVGNAAFKRSNYSLFGTLNYTHTAMASRLLRTNILAPITAQTAIESRLDLVSELMQSEDRYTSIKAGLKALNKIDLDKLIASLIASENRPSPTSDEASSRVKQMLDLRTTIRSLARLRSALQGGEAELMKAILKMISDERLDNIEAIVSRTLNDSGTSTKGGIGAINAKVYLVKANCSRLLDVARETFKENISDIYSLQRALAEKHELPISLVYQANGGFIFALRKSDLSLDSNEAIALPEGFINRTSQKGRWLFSSLELKKLNARMKDALDETLLLSNKIIGDLLGDILIDVGVLYKASEAIAMLDMLWSFAYKSILQNYTRPEFTGTLAIKSGRHPILECVKSSGAIVPNDVYICDSTTFQMILGPNMSGKSTYIRQIGLLTVMAMCGCFVPAAYASFRIHDQLLTRLSNDDDIEKNFSTFANEMASVSMILGLATENSLVLIDEVGRGTSPAEGVGIAHAIAEALISLKAFTLFATHFKELIVTLSRQPAALILHLKAQNLKRSAGIKHHYRVMDGPPDEISDYGLELARMADLPKDVFIEARRVSSILKKEENDFHRTSQTTKVMNRRKALLHLRTQLSQAYDWSALPENELRAYVGRFQADIAKIFLEDDGTSSACD